MFLFLLPIKGIDCLMRDIALWHLMDGQCLQTRHERNDGVQGIVQGAQIHSCGALICYGECNNIVVLDGATLEIITLFDLFGNWIVAMSLFATDSKDVDTMLLMDADGLMYSMRLDMAQQKCIQETPVPSFVLPAHKMGNTVTIQYNPFDPKLFMVVERDFCEILHVEFSSLAQIHNERQRPAFQGGRFLSAKTVLVWNERGGSDIYYLGATSDIQCNDVRNLSPRDIVLVSDGKNAIYVDRLDIGPYALYNNTVRISFSHTNELRTILFPTPINPTSFKQCLVSISCDPLQHIEVEICSFWASLFGSNVPLTTTTTTGTTGEAEERYSSVVDMVLSLPVTTRISMKDLWDIPPVDNPFTTMTCILKNYIAVGFLNGDIAILSQSTILMHHPSDWHNSFVQSLKGHDSPITALHVPDYTHHDVKKFLLSGDGSGHVMLWNASSGQKLGSFYNHSLRVLRFLPVPPEASGKSKHTVMSIGQDHSIGLIHVEECTSVSFVGHGKQIVGIYWRSGDHSMMLVYCRDDSLYIWHLKSGHLDRIERGPNVVDILASTDTTLVVSYQQDTLVHSKQTCTVATFPISDRCVPVIAVVLINVKRLIDEMSNGEVSSPTVPRKNGAEKSQTRAVQNTPPAQRKRTSVFLPQRNVALDLLKKAFPSTTLVSTPPRKRSVEESAFSVPETRQSVLSSGGGGVAGGGYEKRGSRPDTDLVRVLFSCMMSWGMVPDVDEFCKTELGVMVPARGSIGVRGAGGYLSFPIISKEDTPLSDWCCSATQTSQRILTIVATIRSLITNYNLPHDVTTLMRTFGSMIPNPTTPHFQLPSLSVLIKFWQDPISDIQEASRFLIARMITTMPPTQLHDIVEYWSRLVPVQEPITSKTRCRAAVILGLVGSILPESLSMNVCYHVCTSLEIIIKDENKNAYRLLAIELIGLGFKSWEPHLNGPLVIRTLVNLTGLRGQQPTNIPFLSPPNMLMARQSLMQIACINTGLFISTIAFDLIHSKQVLEKVAGLKLFGLFITRV
jgi:hypothetical protein